MIFQPMFEGFMGSMMSSSTCGNTAQLEAELATHESDLKMVESKKKSLYAAYKLDLYILDAKRERLLQDNKLDHIVTGILRQQSLGRYPSIKSRKRSRVKNRRIQPTDNEQLLLLQKHDNETSFLKKFHEEEYEKLKSEQRRLTDLIYDAQMKLGYHGVRPSSSRR